MARDLVAEFFKNEDGSLELLSMTVLQDEKGHDGRPFRSRSQYDVDRSKAYGYIFHISGAGGGEAVEVAGPYWTSGNPSVREVPTTFVDATEQSPWDGPKTTVIRGRNRTQRIAELPTEFDLSEGEDLLSWLESNAIEQESFWCSVCRDSLPAESLCEHIWWCDKDGWYSTPDDRCSCASREECEKEEEL